MAGMGKAVRAVFLMGRAPECRRCLAAPLRPSNDGGARPTTPRPPIKGQVCGEHEMYLIEESQIPDAALPVARLRDHLRLGSGFVEDGLQDGLLGGFLRAAIAAVEARTGKALLVRDFLCSLHRWRDVTGQVLPIAPVQTVTQITLVDAFGAGSVVSANRYVLVADGEAPKLAPVGACLPSIPEHGSAELRFEAGMAGVFGDLPADMAQAVMLLAAHYYEYRDETALGQGCMPFGVTSLIARYRPVRLGFGT